MNDEFYFSAIIGNVRSTANFRRRQALRYPSDERNTKAAEQLDKLAAAAFSSVAPDAWAELKPHLQDDCFPDALSEATKAVAFRGVFPKDITGLIRNLTASVKAFGLPALAGAGR